MKAMKRGWLWMLVVLLGAATVHAEEGVVLQIRLYKGVREGGAPATTPDSGDYRLRKMADDYIIPGFEFAEELDTIVRIYRLQYAHFQVKADLVLPKGSGKASLQDIDLSGRLLGLQISSARDGVDRFGVRVSVNDAKQDPLLETEIIVPQDKTAVLGFEDSRGDVYFLAVHRRRDRVLKPGNGVAKTVEAPRLLKRVVPRYPASARERKSEGVVLLEGHTDTEGNVNRVFVVRDVNGLAEVAAASARLWKYSPWKINGTAEPVRFHLMIVFRLARGSGLYAAEGVNDVDGLYEKYRPQMKRWRFAPDVSEENKAIVEVIMID